MDAAVADVFGFHALQLGLPELDGLCANRMPHRWLAHEEAEALAAAEAVGLPGQPGRVALCCLPEALPFANDSLDLVVMPHTLEPSEDPHRVLAEAVRVLRPEGRLVISGFNPLSLWGARHARLGGGGVAHLPAGRWVAPRRVRDWLQLLSCEVALEQRGCYGPALASQAWLARWAWLEPAGQRWWAGLGAAYVLVAIKRVRGMRLIGLARSARRAGRTAAAVASRRGL